MSSEFNFVLFLIVVVPTRLNDQIILIMSDLGVPDDTFFRLQQQWFEDKERPPRVVE